MATPYIPPTPNAVAFVYNNDTYQQNAFNSLNDIQMYDNIFALDIAETIGATVLNDPKNKYITEISETIGASDSSSTVFLLKFLESIGVADDINIKAQMQIALNETLGITDNSSTTSKLFMFFNENLGVIDDLKLNATQIISLSESLGASVFLEDFNKVNGITIADTGLDTYSMNFKNGAFSRYTDFSFTGAVKFKDHYFISNGNGIFKNTGMMNNFKSGIKTGLIRFGGDVQARIDYAFLAVKNSGAISIKVIGSDGLVKIYSLTNTSTTIKDKRVLFGKGDGLGGARKCSYFQFEITSNNGSFELDNLSVYKLQLSRKT